MNLTRGHIGVALFARKNFQVMTTLDFVILCRTKNISSSKTKDSSLIYLMSSVIRVAHTFSD